MAVRDDDPVALREHPDFPESQAPAPRANADLLGNAEAERSLAQAAADGTLAGAWLIGGPEGIGKATLAYRLARHLLAGGGNDLFGGAADTLAIDEAEPAFARVAGGSHGDLLTVELGLNKQGKKRTEIVVEDIRRLEPFFRQSAGEGGWRIAVIDGADLMNRNAANAALKLIEEPPRQSLVILVSHTPAKLLATIRSRCRKLNLRPLKDEQAAVLLERFLPDMAEEDRLPLARLSGGSPGRAMRLEQMGGLDLYREIMALMADAPHMDPAALHALADRLGRSGQAPACRTALDFLSAWLAGLVRYASEPDTPLNTVVTGEEALISRFAARGNLEHWVDVWEKITRLRDRADSLNLDRKQVVLAVFGAVEAAVRT
ncbi:MAG: DNA polymerase III subunit delta' [Rhodospirillaceae bacterium]|nr:DNA polymerase III subunit delta' [Rhodospirillaceae bacterium]